MCGLSISGVGNGIVLEHLEKIPVVASAALAGTKTGLD
jgi:hypothetical protein